MRTILGLAIVLVVVGLATHSPAQTPEHFWSKRFGDVGDDAALGVAADGAGNVVVVGYFFGNVNFGGSTLVSAGGNDIFVAKYNASGVHQWSQRFGSAGDDIAYAVALDASGNVLVTGYFNGTVNFGGANLGSAGNSDIFVAKYNASGVHQWSQRFGSSAQDGGNGIALDGPGNVFVTGYFYGTVNFGGTNLVSAGFRDIFLAKYNSSGVHQWSQRFGSADQDEGRSVAVDGAGNVVVTGSFQNATVDFGGGGLVNVGGYDIFLAKYNSSGVHQWSQSFGSTQFDQGESVALDGLGNVLVTGSFSNTVDFGGGGLVSAGVYDIFLAKYNSSGVHQWSERFGSSGIDSGQGVAVDALGNVVLTGSFDFTVNFGGGGLVSAAGSDIFIAKYNASGAHRWSRRVGDVYDDGGDAIAVDGSKRAVVVGRFRGTVDFGGGNLGNAVLLRDAFVAKYGDPTYMTKILDHRFDNGKHVEIHFMPSAHDAPGTEPLVTLYEAFRRIDSPGGPAFLPVAGIPASMAGEYVMDAPTEADSSCAPGPYDSFFFIRAHTVDPGVFFDSPIDSGYSADNIPPGIPTNLVFAPPGQLLWDASTDGDFDHFTVYGSNTNAFASATFVGSTVSPGMNVPPPPYLYYFVTATDHACNEGAPASTATPTGVGGTPTSYVLSISAYPNPFNPLTTIRYTLPTRGRVTINVFDARGAHVATLVDAVTAPGAYTRTWNGRDNRGHAVSSGVFFARLTSAAGERTYKMTLLK